MINLGIHHQFDWVETKNDIDPSIKYDLSSITMKLSVQVVYCKLINADTGAETNMSLVDKSHDIGDTTIVSTGITGAIPTTGSFYLEISVQDGLFSSVLYSDGIINYSNCTLEIQTRNSCSDEYYDWDTETFPSIIKIAKYQYLEPSFETEKTTKYTSNGKIDKVTGLFMLNRFEFVAPTSYIKLLNGIVHNDTNSIKDYNNNTIPIKNVNVEPPEKLGNGKYSKFVVTYEYENTITGNKCCEILSIDDIASPEYTGGGGCGTFSVTLNESGGILTPTPSDTPTGTLSYNWYKNGVYQVTSSTLSITESATYKVEARVTDGGNTCIASDSYYHPDECALFQISISETFNIIDATASNVPTGQTVSYSVKKDGVEVSSSLPYEATVTGTYFIHATAGGCSEIKSIYVLVEFIPEGATSFTASISESNGVLTAITTAASPTYLWELETYNSDTGVSTKTSIGVGPTVNLGEDGIYHLSVSDSGTTEKDYYLYLTGANVTITNIDQIANASGATQVIENTTGHIFDFDYDPSRYLVTRGLAGGVGEGNILGYVDGGTPSALDIDEYTVISGKLRLGTSWPLEVTEIVTIRPI